MKKKIKIFIEFLFRIISILNNPRLNKKIKIICSILYTNLRKKELKKIGTNCILSYPLYLHGGNRIEIGDNFNCGKRLRLEAFESHLGYEFSPFIKIGNDVSINSDCHIGSINKIIIEDGVLIASKVFITDHFHGEINSESIKTPPSKRKLSTKGIVKIEKNVWIGEGVVILPNVLIGRNSIIGANSVITKNIPKNSVVAGNPSRIIRTL